MNLLGRNFAAGMSGGIAYVLKSDNESFYQCNLGMVDLETVDCPEESAYLRSLVQTYADLTTSPKALDTLAQWNAKEQYIKVMPRDYKRLLEAFLVKGTHADFIISFFIRGRRVSVLSRGIEIR